jgi:hypothetical protein
MPKAIRRQGSRVAHGCGFHLHAFGGALMVWFGSDQSKAAFWRSEIMEVNETTVLAWMNSDRMERTADYVKRGRRLAKDDTAALKERWLITFKSLCDTLFVDELEASQEIECELELRGEEAPTELAVSEISKLAAALKRHMKIVRRDADKWDESNRRMNADFDAFAQSVEAAKKKGN